MEEKTMLAAVLTGHGGVDRIEIREDVPVPRPGVGEALVEVTATAKNNTDRKVREGLYPVANEDEVTSFQLRGEPSLTFPRIQGADVVGRIVEVGAGVDQGRVGERGLLDFNIYTGPCRSMNLTPDYHGHGRDGGFAEYVSVPADQFHPVPNPELADAQLAALGMCSYQTALHMLNVARVGAGERVLITGASGGVGSALLQLCRLRGAIPYAVSSSGKGDALLELGAEAVLDRTSEPDLVEAVPRLTGGRVIDAVMDLVGGEMADSLMQLLCEGVETRSSYPRYSIAGASGGNVTKVLWSRVYLYQIQIFGVSHGTREEAEQLVEWIRTGQLRPVLHGTFKLSDIHRAERYFVDRGRDFVGKIVIVPDARWSEHGVRFAVKGGPT